MKNLILAALALLLCACGPKGYSGYSWEYHELDSRYDAGENSAVEEAISAYDSLMTPLQEVICYSNDVYSKEPPESGLSNFLADALRGFAEKYTGETIDVAVTNFGGIRTDLPKGAVRVYDIYAIAPFNNYVTVLTVKGSALRKVFETMASKRSVQALSGVSLKIDGRRLAECLVGGKPIDDKRDYKIATIDFLVTGGDGMDFGEIISRNDTGVLLRDAYIDVMKQMMAEGKTLDLKRDGRVVITNSNK